MKLKPTLEQLKQATLGYIEIISKWEIQNEKKQQILNEKSTNKLVFTICSLLEVGQNKKLLLLELNIEKRIQTMLQILKSKNEELQVAKQLENKVRSEMNQNEEEKPKKRESFVSSLFGDDNSSGDLDDVQTIQKQIKSANLPEKVLKVVNREFKSFKQQSKMMSQEAALIRNYLDTILELPWNNMTQECPNIQAAKDQLDRDHFGLEKVKSRILEFLAVKFLKGNSKGNIICLVGAPGVGKTSLGRSIAKALGRKFERVSLGGVKDSAEIRGHRRTYIGSFPGCIIQAIRRANSKNPVILLDEIDKLDRDHRGDPSSALLEALDPEQNSTFTDHFLNVEFDLSNVMFIATANQLEPISQPLLDRMEVIELDGYQQNEKLQIALKFILPKQLDETGITPEQLFFDEPSLKFLIDGYTQELGVRNLERKIAQICRAVAYKYTLTKQDEQSFIQIKTTPEMIQDILGTKYNFKEDLQQRLNVPGVVVGMAYTQFGGKILIIEVSHCKGKGNIIITGQVKQVMQESVQTALGWIKSNLDYFKDYYNLKINNNDSNSFNFNDFDINVHFPAAAIPKDGPSAGVAITVALVSLLLQRNVRSDVAMTGEVSLKGKVLPIGGVKEKCIAAYENGIRNIILPEQNKQDIEKIPEEIKSKINFVIVQRVEEAIEYSLGFKQSDILKLSKL